MTATQKFIVTIAVLVVLGGGAYLWSNRAQAPTTNGQQATTTPQTTGTTTTTGSNPTPQIAHPDATKPIAFAANIDAGIRTSLNKDLKTVQDEIAKNPLDMHSWVQLGTIHKMAGDYQLAVEYWTYVTTVIGGRSSPYYSIGDVYQNYLHDYTKAEVNYKAAIKEDPNNVDAYASLFTMYHYTLKDDTKAAAIIKDGLAANPNNNYLLGFQALLK